MAKNHENVPQAPASTVPQGWVQQQSGFAPYIEPEAGFSFLATPIDYDDSDPEFGRYKFIAHQKLEGFKGSKTKKEQAPVQINEGEEFTVAAYSGLSAIQDYVGMQCHISVIDKIDIKGGKQTLWRFSFAVSPEDDKEVKAARIANAKLKIAAAKEARKKALAAASS